MRSILHISVRFLDPAPVFHGRRDGNEPEWPPSPLRLFQAIVDAAASRWADRKIFSEQIKPALEWLQQLQPIEIVTPPHHIGTPFRIAVPNNDWDSPARAWAAGREPVKPHRPIDLKTMKSFHPVRLVCANDGDNALHYLYSLPNGSCPFLKVLTAAARSITHLGWGIDMAAGDASILTAEQVAQLQGVRWRPTATGGAPLRTPSAGTLDDLILKHTSFLSRVRVDGFCPVPPLRVFDVVRYRSQDEPAQRPHRVFELRNIDGSRCRYPHRKLIQIAGMVRHLAIKAMKASPPTGLGSEWVETYVAGHASEDALEHRQLSYLPLPSVGHQYTDPGVRRIMIVAPLGDDAWLDHVARHLAGQMLEPLRGDEFAGGDPPLLVPVRRDNVARFYTQPANTWASVTPVILPGHDDHKPEKTRKLIEKALAQSGIEQPCQFEWGAFSRFPKSLSAHKYDKDKKLTGYIRPDHLLSQTAVHLTLRFNDDLKMPGPLAIGAGRHCGLGIFAGCDPT
jgi:CRISPR-associated protein Csb2